MSSRTSPRESSCRGSEYRPAGRQADFCLNRGMASLRSSELATRRIRSTGSTSSRRNGTSRACPTRCGSCSRTCCGTALRRRSRRSPAGSRRTSRRARSRSRRPASLLQDFTGVPCVVDLAAMRNAMEDQGGDPSKINPLIPVELVIDHSVQVDEFASRLAIGRNVELEFERNRERYAFLRWGQSAFDNFAAVPPNTGICHQVNLEFLARVVESRDGVAFPRHARRHRLAHDDGQRPGRARLGRRRHRGRGGDARRVAVDARAAGRRDEAHRRAAAGRDRDRPRPDRDGDPAQGGCRRQVRRVLRRRRAVARTRRPRDAREHEPGVRRDLRLSSRSTT